MYGSELTSTEMGQEYLAHHGVKGQKWGVRRFQNADGTYTDEGKRRRGRNLRKQASRVAKGKASEEERKQFIKDSRDFMDKYGSDKYRAIANSGLEGHVHNFFKSSGIINPGTPIRNVMEGVSNDYDYDKIPYNPKGKTLKERYPGAGDGWDSKEWNDKLFNHIGTKSINWYEGVPVSKAAKQWTKERDEMEKSGYSIDQRRKHNKKLLSIVLKDLDLPDTENNRKAIEPYVFID